MLEGHPHNSENPIMEELSIAVDEIDPENTELEDPLADLTSTFQKT